MANFAEAQPHIIRNEGGYVNDPHDSGGETYRGITRKNFPKWEGWSIVDANKPMHRGQIIDSGILAMNVNQFYKSEFWDKMQGDALKNQALATYIYDFKVTSGGNAVKVLQRLLGIPDTGNLGPITLAAVNGYTGDLLTLYHLARIKYYTEIGVGKNSVFVRGWLNRCNAMYDALK